MNVHNNTIKELKMRYLIFIIFAALCLPKMAHAQRIVMLGDSLTAGYGLESGQSLTTELEAIIQQTHPDIYIDNAGVSGDTTAGGLSRLDWAIEGDTTPSLVIVALGANDMLRAQNPNDTYNNLDQILKTLKDKKIPAMLVGMRAPMNMGVLFTGRYDSIFPKLAKKHKIPLYPFLLEGVALNPALNLPDGLHPNIEGTKIIAQRLAPEIIKAIQTQ